jgi:hypothetical protein
MKFVQDSQEFELADFYGSLISSAIWKKHTRVSFSKTIKLRRKKERKEGRVRFVNECMCV